MGHLLTDQGIKPDPTKTDAVHSMANPVDKHDVQRFLGMTNCLSKFTSLRPSARRLVLWV